MGQALLQMTTVRGLWEGQRVQILVAHGGQYVSGVFQWDLRMLDYMVDAVGPDLVHHQAVVRRDLDYPLFLTEDQRGFHFFSRAAIWAELSRFVWDEHVDDEAHCYAYLYRVAEDFHPPRSDVNMMSRLPHHAVTSALLRRCQLEGFDLLWR